MEEKFGKITSRAIFLLSLVMSGAVDVIYVTHKDRLVRFGFELISFIAKFFGTKIVFLENSSLNDDELLASDMVSIITVFSARAHGRRSHRNKRLAKSLLEKSLE